MPAIQLLDSLQGIRRRVKRLAIAFGAGLLVASAAVLLLAIVLFDYAFSLPVPARLVLMLMAALALGYVLVHWVLHPASSGVSLGDVAGRLEHTFPQFDDRLRSTIDFVRADIPGSELMKQRVVSQATAMAGEVDLGRVIVSRPVWYSSAAALASVLLVFGIGMLAGRSYLGIAFNRLGLGAQPWPKSVEISVTGDVPQRVPVGQRIPVRIRLTKGDKESRKAVIFYRYDNGPWQQELMTRADGEYTASLDARIDQSKTSGQVSVRLEAGDDAKVLPAITIVPRLDLARLDADVLPPAYVKPRQSTTINLGERPAVVAVGSEVALRLNFNKPLAPGKPVELIAASGHKLPAGLRWDSVANAIAGARFQATDSVRFSVRATDIDGFQNTAGEEYEVVVREDQPPTVQIEEPRRSEDRTPDAEFDVKAVAEDDYGIDGAQLVVARLGDKNTSQQKNNWVIDLVRDARASAVGTTWEPSDSTGERKRFRLGYHWELAKLAEANLKPGDVLEFFVQVKDNFDLNGRQHPWVASGKLRVTIISHADWDKKVQEVFESTFAALKTIDQGQLRNKGETETLKQGLDQKKKFDDADQTQSERLANQQSGTASQTQQVSQKLGQLLQKMGENKSAEGGMKKTAAEVKKQLEQTSDGPMRDAARNLNDAAQSKPDPKASAEQQQKDAEQRSQAMSKSARAQQQSSDELRQAMDRLGNFGGLSDAIQKMEKIRNDQQKNAEDFNKQMRESLGKKPEEMSKQEQETAKKLADAQKALGDRTQNALDEMSRKSEQMSKTDPTASEAMKQAAQTGQQQQVPGKQSQAAQSMRQNQQAQAQQQQKQVELGIDMIINKLKEAERRKLEELARQLEEVQRLIAELIQRQAGHNIDNLLLQGGGDRLAKVETSERSQLIELSARDPKTVSEGKPQLQQLSPSQEQSERNARDLAKVAEALPDPAPSAKLTAAAGQMERAAVHLRNARLPDAYDPPQVDALRNLVDARTAIDEALKKAQDQLKQEDEETIKQAYVKLLEQQKKVGGDIVAIDGTGKDPSGELPRETAVKLGQMPGQQGKLSDEAGRIGKQLETLGSVVYVWANKDIVRSMNEVKDDLAKPATGKPTQLEERRIEEQLQAMIDNLAQRKKDNQFENRGGGGGGGGSKKPRMPTEAELRLQKALQEAVNKNTTDLDKEPAKDNQKLLALGGRQGELREVFGQLIQKASGMKLAPEPDNRDQLPEEAKKEDVENQELEKGLLSDDLSSDAVENKVKLTEDRMARSRQRLALNDDPGKITQEIQKRIVTDLDKMIELAQQQQSQSKPRPGSGKPGDQIGPPKPAPGQQPAQANASKSHQEQGNSPAQQSTNAQGSDPNLDLSKDIKEKMAEWGGITARDRQAVQEGAGEKVLDKYRTLVKDYYQSLSKQAAQR